MRHFSVRQSMRRCLAAPAIVLAAVLLAACGGSRDDVPLAFSTTLSGAGETPPIASQGIGAGLVTVEPDSRAMLASVVTSGIAETAVHIHEGRPGEIGALLFPLARDALSGAWIAHVTLTQGQLAALQAGHFYFSVRSNAHPGGELRGQIFEQLPSQQELNLLQPMRFQSAQIDQQLRQVQQIVDDARWPHSGFGIGFGFGFGGAGITVDP